MKKSKVLVMCLVALVLINIISCQLPEPPPAPNIAPADTGDVGDQMDSQGEDSGTPDANADYYEEMSASQRVFFIIINIIVGLAILFILYLIIKAIIKAMKKNAGAKIIICMFLVMFVMGAVSAYEYTEDSHENIPYAPPYDVFDNNKDLYTISEDQFVLTPGNQVIEFDVNVSHENGVIYRKAYYYDYNQSEWESFNFPQVPVGNSNWIREKASATLSITASNRLKEGENYIVTYSCKKQGPEWKCGCDTINKCGEWMLHVINVTDIAEPAVPAVGEEPIVPLGTPENPYEISNCDELQEMINNSRASYILVNDIDCSDTINWNNGQGFNPIGYFGYCEDPRCTGQFSCEVTTSGCHSTWHDMRFNGNLDGDGYKIKNLYIRRGDYTGLFGRVGYTGKIEHLGLENISFYASRYSGGLVGLNNGTINRCYVAGEINGSSNIGGLVGWNRGYIKNSYSSGNIYSQGGGTGGLVGYNTGKVSNCYSDMNYSFYASYGTRKYYGVAGLVGSNQGGFINNSFATGLYTKLFQRDPDSLFGITAYTLYPGAIENCFWNKILKDPSTCSDAGGCTTINNNIAYFYNKNNPPMNSWNFTDVWLENIDDLPSLR